MGERTNISWTDSTINCWHGCNKVSAGCKHCYAEVSTPVRVKRAKGLEVWGRDAARDETKSWERDLRRWNMVALALRAFAWILDIAAGRTPDEALSRARSMPWRVFGQSLSDTFEDYQGGRVILTSGSEDASLFALRAHFLEVVEECTALTFQLLTKRPENVKRMVPPHWLVRGAPARSRLGWPRHVWIGCTVEDQENADRRIPHLLRVPAAVRFLSVEPQIGPVDLRMIGGDGQRGYDALAGIWRADDGTPFDGVALPLMAGMGAVSWVIQGGESGPRARPFYDKWMRDTRDQCRAAGVAWFPKQMGAHVVTADASPWPTGVLPVERLDDVGARIIGDGWRVRLRDSHGGDESEWPADLRGCRTFPEAP